MRKFLLATLPLLAAPLCTPVHAAAGDSGPLVVVVNRAAQQIGIFKVDGQSLAPLRTLPAGDTPREVCLSADGKRAYVSNQKGKSVTVVDLQKLEVAATITHDSLDGPDGCVSSADSSKLYVVATKRNAVVAISTRDNKVVKEIALPLAEPRRLALSPDGSKIFVAADKTPKIAVIDAANGALATTFDVGNEPRGMAFTPDGKTLLVTQVVDDTITAVDLGTYKVTGVRGSPLSPQRLAMSPDGSFAYVLTRMQPELFALPLKGPHDDSRTLELGKLPWGLAMNPAGTLLYVTGSENNNIQIVDTKSFKVVANVPAGKDPNGIAYRP